MTACAECPLLVKTTELVTGTENHLRPDKKKYCVVEHNLYLREESVI